MLDLSEFKKKYNYNVATPMMQQYLDIKFEHQNSLLLFRMGDFYELFFDDALTASKALGLAIAKRGKHGEDDLQMCGVPYHALDSYLHKLVSEGYIIAICEQLESPEEAKKRQGYKAVVSRGVVRVITPGTITEEAILPAYNPNYLVAVKSAGNKAAIAYLDISTAEFKVTSILLEDLIGELAKLDSREIIISESDANRLPFYRASLVVQVESYFAVSKCKKLIEKFYNINSYAAIGSVSDAEISVIGAILEYVNITQKNNIPELALPRILNSSNFMIIDAATRRNLELNSTISGQYKGSLLSSINYTVTKSGSRLLHSYLSSPLTNINEIEFRHDIVEFLLSNINLTQELRGILSKISDIERIIMRISMKRCIPRDLLALHEAIDSSVRLAEILQNIQLPDAIKSIISSFNNFQQISQNIKAAIREDAPNNLQDGLFIKKSYDTKLHDLYKILENNNEVIESLKIEYQAKTGIESLKICQNNILGVFIEITPKNIHKMTDSDFIHKQTIATAVRYTTEKLRAIESDKVSAQRLAINLEQEIFWKICSEIMEISHPLRELAHKLSQLDVFTSLATLAFEHNYIRPEIDETTDFIIENGRHVTVEQNISRAAFIPNNCNLNNGQRLWLITGPNMAGKSTFLRQNALIIILAQMGSFIPASFAKIGIVDKLFSRIGASDDLAKGQSTFMVEMIETAAILSQSTARSFIILDEIGRGTSTYDGVSIAWGCLEHIHNILKCRSLFATHYHELTALSATEPALRNYTIDIKEDNGSVIFLHKIIPGIADKSYGIHVAELAGIPKSVIKRSYEVLKSLEKNSKTQQKNIDSLISNNYNLFDHGISKTVAENKLEKALSEIKPDELSPKEAHDKLYELKKMML